MNSIKKLTLSSLEVSKMLNKNHSHLVRDIEIYNGYFGQNPKLVSDTFWQESSYKSGTGKSYKCYLITKKGCEFLAHKMTGKKGALFTATYINRFHDMEAKLKSKIRACVPAQAVVLTPLTWNGTIMMENVSLMRLTGISNATLLMNVKRLKLSFLLMMGDDLIAFKEENSLTDSCISRLILYPEETVIALLKYLSLYNVNKTTIKKYFHELIRQPHYSSFEDMIFDKQTLSDNELLRIDLMIKTLPYAADEDDEFIMNEVIIHLLLGKKFLKMRENIRKGFNKCREQKRKAAEEKDMTDDLSDTNTLPSLQGFFAKLTTGIA